MKLQQQLGRHERFKKIGQAATQPLGLHWVTLKDGPKQIPILELDQQLLLYRADNGRLLAELGKRFAGQKVQLKRLKEQEESTDTQTLLHELLVTKAGDPEGPILEELRRLGVQTEPLLADASGVVINGNRRLSAMRLLLEEDRLLYARFLKPQVAVLPKAVSRKDLEYLETSLQLAPETKLPYGWVERRLKLRHQMKELGLDAAWILEAYRLNSEDQLDAELAELELVETYLKDWHGTSCDYAVVANTKALFEGLNTQLTHLKGPIKKVWKTIGLLLILQRQHLPPTTDRLYPFTASKDKTLPTQVLQRLAVELACIDTRDITDLKKSSLSILQNTIQNAKDRQVMATKILSLVEEVQEQQQQDQIPARILKNLKQSNRLLEKIQTDALPEHEKAKLLGEAAAIKSRLDLLIGTNMVVNPNHLKRRWRLHRWVLKRLSRS